MKKQCIACGGINIQEVLHESRNYYFCQDCNKLHERALDSRYGRDTVIEPGKPAKHLSVGGLIQEGNRYLLIKRKAYPFGYSFPAGHIEVSELPFDSLKREIHEETALVVKEARLIFEGEIEGDICRYGADVHMWYFYVCKCEAGLPVLNQESEGIGWFTRKEALDLPLVPVAQFFFDEVIRT